VLAEVPWHSRSYALRNLRTLVDSANASRSMLAKIPTKEQIAQFAAARPTVFPQRLLADNPEDHAEYVRLPESQDQIYKKNRWLKRTVQD